MDWKDLAIDSLKLYNARKVAIENIPCEIGLIDRDIQITDEAVKGSVLTGSVGDVQLSRRIMQKELERNLAATQKAVEDIRQSLNALTDEEYHILDRLYMQKGRESITLLCAELNCSKATMYRKRDSALRKYAKGLYGIS